MKILLDENFPLALFRRLQAEGEHVEHIITLGWRGASDQRIRERLLDSELLFLTQDEDFLSRSLSLPSSCSRGSSSLGAWRNESKSGVRQSENSRRISVQNAAVN